MAVGNLQNSGTQIRVPMTDDVRRALAAKCSTLGIRQPEAIFQAICFWVADELKAVREADAAKAAAA